MPMTRELKKRLMDIDQRISKVEKKAKVQRTNGEDLDTGSSADLESRLEIIEMVLQIPGEKQGDTEILSAWREIIENKLMNIETVLVIPGPDPFLSGFAAKVDEVLTQVKTRLLKLEQTPDPSSENPTVRQLESVKSRLRGSEEQRHTVVYLQNELKGFKERLLTLEQKPVAGALSQVTGKMAEDIREHELELFGVGGKETGNGLTNRINDLTQTVTTIRRAVGFIMGPILIILLLIRILTLIF